MSRAPLLVAQPQPPVENAPAGTQDSPPTDFAPSPAPRAPSFVFETPLSQRQGVPLANALPASPTADLYEIAGKTFDETLYVENFMAREAARHETAKKIIRDVYETTGVELPNPMENPIDAAGAAVWEMMPGELPEGFTNTDRAIDDFDTKIAELRLRNPDKAWKIPAAGLRDQALDFQREIFAKAEDARARGGDVENFFGGLGGGLAGSFGDPLQVATLPIGFGARTILGAVLKEAAVNAGITGGLELVRDKAAWKDVTGKEYTLDDFLSRTGTAAVFGGGLGGAGKFGEQSVGRLFFDRTAFEVFREKYDALPPDHPLRKDETTRRAIDAQAAEYRARDARPVATNEDADAANRANALRQAIEPEAPRDPDPVRDEISSLIAGRASAEDIWNSQAARDADASAALQSPTLERGAEIPEDRVYSLPGDGAVGALSDIDGATDWLLARAQDAAGPEGVARNKRALFVMGYPGAGKSTFVESFARVVRGAFVDADLAKTIIPEYDGGRGSQVVHTESAQLRQIAVEQLAANGDNIVFETVGDNPAALMKQVAALKARGYDVQLAHVRVDPDEAVRRAWGRWLKTGRSVQPGYAKAIYGKVEPSFDALVESGAFSGYMDIDYSGARQDASLRSLQSEARAGGSDVAGEPGRGGAPAGRGPELLDQAQGARGIPDLEAEVDRIVQAARLAATRPAETPPPTSPAAIFDSSLDPALARAADDPTPENLVKATEVLERAILEDMARKPPREPKRLRAFLRGIGGMKDHGGELRQLADIGQRRPDRLVNNKTGLDPDIARVKAWEEGYFYGAEPPELDEFLNALADDYSEVTPRYRQDDLQQVDDYLAYQELRARVERAEDIPFPDGVDDAGNPVAFSYGIRAWHGSRHAFNRFEWNEARARTGEGTNAFGSGLYFAENENIARFYSRFHLSVRDDDPARMAGQYLVNAGGKVTVAAAELRQRIKYLGRVGLEAEQRLARKVLRQLEAGRAIPPRPNESHLYEVELKVDYNTQLLDLDAPLTEQHPDVQAAVTAAWSSAMKSDPAGMTGEQIIRALGAGPEASALLLQHGVKGVRFYDAKSRDRQAGTRNFVIFNADDVATITRNGEPVAYSRRASAGPPASADEIRAAATAAYGDGAGHVFDVAPPPKSAPAEAKAMTDKTTGKITLFEGRVAAAEAPGLVLHEIGAHAGIEAMMTPAAWSDLLATVEKRALAGKGAWANVLASIPDDTPTNLRAEEMLGYFLELNADNAALMAKEPWWRELLTTLRDWAAKALPWLKRETTDAEIVTLARGAVDAAIAGRDPAISEGAAYSQGSPTGRAQPAPAGTPASNPKNPAPGQTQAPQGPPSPALARQRHLEALTTRAQKRIGIEMARFRNGSGERDVGEFLQAVLDYQGQGSGMKLSVDGLRKAIISRSLGEIEALLHHFRAGTAGRRVNKADLDNFVKEMFGEDTKDPAAKALAQAVAPTLDKLRQRFNAAGGQIGKLERWGLPQAHNALAMRNWIEKNGGKVAGRAALKQKLYDSLDLTRMRDIHTGRPMSANDVFAALDSVVADMISDGWATRTPSRSAVTPGMLANQRADHRFLIFKDAQTWLGWQREFGQGDPVTAVVAHVERMARDIAAMEILGPNPNSTIEWLQQVALAQAGQAVIGLPAQLPARVLKRKAPEAYVAGKVKRMDEMWENYTGSINVPVNERLARNGARLRNLLTSATLGSAILSAMPTDPVFQAFARSFAGTGHAKMVELIVRQTKNPREAAQLQLIMDHALATFGDDAKHAREFAGANATSVLAGQVLAASGLTPWTRGGRQVFQMGFLADMGNLAGDAYADLPKAFQRTFQRYGIDAAAWDTIRAAPLNSDGFMTPANIERAGGLGLSDRVLHMIMQETEYAVPSGTLRSRSFMRGRDQAGTFMGELRQSGRMFLSFSATLPMLYGYRLAHQLRGGDNWTKAQGAMYFGALAGTLMFGGAVAMQLKNYRDGKDLQDMKDAQFWQAAFLQGGGLGIYGDFLFGNLNRMDRSLGETIAGPAVGFLSDAQEATIGELSKEFDDNPDTSQNVASTVGKLILGNVPGSSLWYLKGAYDRWIEDGFQRLVDPKADDKIRRAARKLQQTTGQGYFWARGSALPQRGPVMSEAPPPQP